MFNPSHSIGITFSLPFPIHLYSYKGKSYFPNNLDSGKGLKPKFRYFSNVKGFKCYITTKERPLYSYKGKSYFPNNLDSRKSLKP